MPVKRVDRHVIVLAGFGIPDRVKFDTLHYTGHLDPLFGHYLISIQRHTTMDADQS